MVWVSINLLFLMVSHNDIGDLMFNHNDIRDLKAKLTFVGRHQGS
jgi:hypothetical protein